MKRKSSVYLLIFFLFSLLVGGVFLFLEKDIENDLSSIEFLDISFQERLPVFLRAFSDLRDEYILSKRDFVEVNLEQMKIRIFKQGLLEKELPILAKGDSLSWGGSAVGLYQVLRGFKTSFSSIEEVYMPYALHYYGKYYIHGEPYYPSGQKLVSFVSGGCLRLKDEDAKELFELVDLNMPVLVIDKEKEVVDYPVSNNLPEVSASSFLVADLDSGFVFSEKDSSQILPIASLTKLMTAVVIVENVNLRRSVLIREKMLELGYGTTEGLEPEKRFRVVELFYPLLIESSNDSAFALTWFLGRDKTVELMNQKADSILMQNTSFVEPSGFDPQNTSSAQDLFQLARYILNNRYPLLEITKGNKVTSFGKIGFDIEKLWNKNIFIHDPTFIGGKTGYIIESKQTAVFLFQFNERRVAIILLGSSSLRKDTQKLYIWLQKNYFN